MLTSRLRENIVGKRSDVVQTDHTLVITNLEEPAVQTMNSCVHYEDLNVTFDRMMTMVRELSKKVDDLINP